MKIVKISIVCAMAFGADYSVKAKGQGGVISACAEIEHCVNDQEGGGDKSWMDSNSTDKTHSPGGELCGHMEKGFGADECGTPSAETPSE